MLLQNLKPSRFLGVSLLAIGCLLLSFVMLGSRWLKNYLYAFAAESWFDRLVVGAHRLLRELSELYLIALLTLLFSWLLRLI